MKRKIEHLRVRFILGSITLVVGLIAANTALFHWVERVGVQYLFGDYSRYVLGFGGFAAMIFGAMLINDAWVLRSVLKGKYELPNQRIIRNHKSATSSSWEKRASVKKGD